MTNGNNIKSILAMLALAFTMALSGPLPGVAFAEDMAVSEDEDEDDNGNSEDHANENADEHATGGDEDECGATIENSRC